MSSLAAAKQAMFADVRHRLLLPTLVMLTTVTAVVSSLGAPMVPAIARDQSVSLVAAQWSLTAALLSGAVATPLLGRLGSGRRRRAVLILGMTVVTAGAVVSAIAPSFLWLVVGRAAQGIGVALTPLAIAVARDELPRERISSAVAVLSVTTVAGAGLGFPVTAWIAAEAGLSTAFWLGAAVCAATGLLTAAVIPASRSNIANPVDWIGGALLAAGTTGVLLALTQAPAWGWVATRTAALAASSVALLAWWVHRSLNSTIPLIDLRLAFHRRVVAANATAASAGVAVYMLLALVMVVVQAPRVTFGLGEPVTTAGLLLVPYAVATLISSRLSLTLGRYVRPDLLLPLGAVSYLAASTLLAFRHSDVGSLGIGMALAGFGSGFTFVTMARIIVRVVPPRETGSAMAFNHLLRFLGFATGSTMAIVTLETFRDIGLSPDEAFRATLLVVAALWGAVCVLCLTLSLPAKHTTRKNKLPSPRAGT